MDVDFDDPYLLLELPVRHARLPPPCVISVMNVSFGYEGYRPCTRAWTLGWTWTAASPSWVRTARGKSTAILKLLAPSTSCPRRVLATGTPSCVWRALLAAPPGEHGPRAGLRRAHEVARRGDAAGDGARSTSGGRVSGDARHQAGEACQRRLEETHASPSLAWKPSRHIMLLDEPTNHLDLETIEALAMARTTSTGGSCSVARRTSPSRRGESPSSRRATCWRRRRSRPRARVQRLVRGVRRSCVKEFEGGSLLTNKKFPGKGGEGGAREGGEALHASRRRRRKKKGTRADEARALPVTLDGAIFGWRRASRARGGVPHEGHDRQRWAGTSRRTCGPSATPGRGQGRLGRGRGRAAETNSSSAKTAFRRKSRARETREAAYRTRVDAFRISQLRT